MNTKQTAQITTAKTKRQKEPNIEKVKSSIFTIWDTPPGSFWSDNTKEQEPPNPKTAFSNQIVHL